MNTERRYNSSWNTIHLREDSARSAQDLKPCISVVTRTQLGRRLKAIYDCDQAPMPASIENLLTQIEASLHCRK